MNEVKGRLTRRAVLRGLGAAVALPWFESLARAGEQPPLRAAFFYVPNGMHIPDWLPESEGPLAKLPPILAPLEKHKSRLLLLSELTLNGGRPLGDGAGDHARAVASFLTGAHPYKTNGKDYRNGISVDQVAAAQVGGLARLASLELGCEPSAQAGNCDSGYSCVYTSNMSWRTPTSPMTKEVNPRAVFDRLFGVNRGEKDQAAAAERLARRKSVLDFARDDADRLRKQLGAADHRKLDEYLYAVRDVERRIERAEARPPEPPAGTQSPPPGLPREFEDHVTVMLDMIALAFRTDSTRVVTCMFTNAGSNRSYPKIGVRSGHHELSHHGRDKSKQAQIAQINRHHVGLFARLLDRLAEAREADGKTLLDHSILVYGSGIGDGDRHNHENLPILVAGGGGGMIAGGRHVRCPKETPLTNLYLTILQRLGCRERSFSDSTGPLSLS